MTITPINLRCEHRAEVPTIGSEAPRFDWALEAEGRGRSQRAYRVLVASAPALLAEETGDLWDSGRVESSRTVEVRYDGKPLPPASEFFWTVQVWDERSEASAWAEPVSFRAGLESWEAHWTFPDRSEDLLLEAPDADGDPEALAAIMEALEPSSYLRREFEVAPGLRRATVFLTARGLVELELNGEKVGDEALAPGWTDYHKRIEYSVHDVTARLRSGANALGASLGEGWYSGFVGMEAKDTGHLYGNRTELLCELHLEFEDGRVEKVLSGPDWRGSVRGPRRYSDLQRGEREDARLRFDGWSEPGFDDREWLPVESSPLDDAALVPAKSQPMRVVAELRPVSIQQQRPGVHLVDFGQNFSGWVRLTATGEAGALVRLRHGEMLDADGELYTENLGKAKQVDSFILSGRGEETFEPRFTIHGFRYLEVSGLAAAPDESAVTGCVVHSDTPPVGEFACSEELVNQLYRNLVWTQRSNFVSIPTDCPQRDERLGWIGDACLFWPTASLNMDVAAFFAKWGEDILDAKRPDGSYSDFAPDPWGYWNGAPGCADGSVAIPWIHHCRYGDLTLLRRHWPHMERFMEWLAKDNPDLLRKRGRNRDYGDWLAVGEETSRELFATAYWARDAELMARMAAALGLADRAAHYEELRAGIASAFESAYVEPDGRVEGDTQTAYLFALGFDLVSAERRSDVGARLVESIERRDWHLVTGTHGLALACPVLAEIGRSDIAHRLLLTEDFPSWGYSIRQGATTIWERWDGYTEERGFQSPTMNSFNHYALGAVGSWLVEGVAGIRPAPDAVAFERVLIEPVPGEMSSARASYRSTRGEIVSDWLRDEGRFRLAVTIPPNVTATVVLPSLGGALLEGGKEAAAAEGVASVQEIDGNWRAEIGSGSYVFESVAA
ncbi:MAG TPA: family 78 glycoside hydrolase catalytic domain [Solirubrobacterales bacterium]|nr:family 78 glycoside hydrolase catalytic domain [Solirubrobacterales bacterium]